MKNTFGLSFKVGDSVKVISPRSGNFISQIQSFEKKGAFVSAYGPRVVLKNGMTCSIDDCLKVE